MNYFVGWHFNLFCRLIRLTSPNLNYLIGAGAIVLYVGVCFYVIPTTSQIVATLFCNVGYV